MRIRLPAWRLPAWRPPDWLAYGAVVAVALGAALARREQAMAPPAPPPIPGAAQMPIAPDSPFASSPVVQVPAATLRTAQTAFSLGEAGVWATASAGLADCKRPGVVVADGRAVEARARARSGPLMILTTAAGAPGLPLAAPGQVQAGGRGFIPAYPRGGPGEVAVRLMGPQTQRVPTRFVPNAPVLAWAEVGHTEGLEGARPGLAGAPVLDARGEVVGVALSESPRRGRIYSTPSEGLRQAIAAAKVALGAAGPGQPIGTDNYGRASDAMRLDARVVQAVCLSGPARAR